MIVTNEFGGKQSKIGSQLSLIPPKAIIKVGEVMAKGAERYEKDNWRKIPIDSQLDHALEHIYKYLANDISDEDHLSHAATRLLMALELRE